MSATVSRAGRRRSGRAPALVPGHAERSGVDQQRMVAQRRRGARPTRASRTPRQAPASASARSGVRLATVTSRRTPATPPRPRARCRRRPAAAPAPRRDRRRWRAGFAEPPAVRVAPLDDALVEDQRVHRAGPLRRVVRAPQIANAASLCGMVTFAPAKAAGDEAAHGGLERARADRAAAHTRRRCRAGRASGRAATASGSAPPASR